MQRVNRILFYLKDMLYTLKNHAFAVLFILVCSYNLRISIALDEQKGNNGFCLKAFIVFDN